MKNDLYFPLLLRGPYDSGLLIAFTVLSEPACLLLRGFAKLLVLPKKLEQRKTLNKGADALLATKGEILVALALT